MQFVFYAKDKLRVRVFRTNFLTYFGQNLTGSKNKFVQRQIAENLDVFDVFLSEMKYAVFRARFLTYLTAMACGGHVLYMLQVCT